MLILGKARAKDSTKGYAATFLHHLDAALEHLVANRIGSSSTPEDSTPPGWPTRRALIATPAVTTCASPTSRRRRLRPPRRPAASRPFAAAPDERRTAVILAAPALTANAYLGGFGIARRWPTAPTSSSPAGSPTPLWSSVPPPGGGWTPDDYDARRRGRRRTRHRMRASSTGGNFSGFRTIADLVQPGFPIAEIAADGSSVITKNPGTGGAVTRTPSQLNCSTRSVNPPTSTPT